MAASYQTKGAGATLRVRESGTPYKTNNDNQPVETEIVGASELSYDEQRERDRLEKLVERAFYEAGRALFQLRGQKLYRSTHKSFDEYCRERFAFTRRHVDYLIAGSQIVDNLIEVDCYRNSTPEMRTNRSHILPTNEYQVRPLAKLEPSEQRECWCQAVEAAGNKVPSNQVVKSIVDKIRERTKIPIPYSEGEVCIIIPKDNPELKGKSGHWCIISNVNEYSCSIMTWDGEYMVKPENLKSLELLEDDTAAMQELCKRLRHLNSIDKIDDIERSILQAMGKRTKPLTPVQEEVLALIEKAYGVG
ncbi:hypothetical protein RIVM261_077770 [Rivularia sp. IAM M-261]|nr:hypothetical protein RIVM261_077770 [Rivularia sp. IAM M-261]